MNLIRFDNVWASCDTPLKSPVRTLLSYRPKGYVHVPAYRNGFWDGWKSVYDGRNDRFPAGLVPYVLGELQNMDLDVGLIDSRSAERQIDYCLRPVTSDIKLMDHQTRAIRELLEWGTGIVEHAVGAGKSFTTIETVRCIGEQALVLVHTKDLMYQIAKDFKEHLNAPGIIGVCGDGIWEPHCVTVATFQTIISRLKNYPDDVRPWLNTIGQVHVDECQHLVAETFRGLMTQLPNAYWRYGYSATPFKRDDLEAMLMVQAHLGPVRDTLTPEEGVEVGRLTPVDLFMVEVEGWAPERQYRIWKGKRQEVKRLRYDQAVQSLLIDHEWRNAAIAKLAGVFTAVGTTLILVDRLEHGEILAEKTGLPFLEGKTKGKLRDAAWEDLRQGRIVGAIATRIADEGLNIPNVAYLILAGGGKAQHRLIQRLGRGRRAVAGKEVLVAVDFADKGLNLGPHTRERLKAYRSDPSINIVECKLEDITGA